LLHRPAAVAAVNQRAQNPMSNLAGDSPVLGPRRLLDRLPQNGINRNRNLIPPLLRFVFQSNLQITISTHLAPRLNAEQRTATAADESLENAAL
jgi:hypothetical protein